VHTITLEVEIDFSNPQRRARGEAAIGELLWWLTRRNIAYLEDHPKAPALYDAGIVYEHESPGVERWQSFERMLVTGRADCEDLACARVAEAIVRLGDRDAKPHFFSRPLTATTRCYHIQCMRGDGTIEDPSRVLGMV
jgi:hypothetical protein